MQNFNYLFLLYVYLMNRLNYNPHFLLCIFIITFYHNITYNKRFTQFYRTLQMDVVGPNQTQLVRRHVYPPQNRRTSTRCRFSVKTAWLAPYWALEADVVSQRVAALSSSHLPNIIHASTLPAARFSIPPCPLHLLPAGSGAYSSSARSRRGGPRSAT